MIINTVTLIRTDLTHKLGENLIWTPPSITLRTVTEDIVVFKTKNSDVKPVHHIAVNSDSTLPPRTETIVSGILTKDNNFHYGLIEYPDTDNSIILVLVASSFVDISRNVIPVRMANISDRAKVTKEGEVLVTCTPMTCINRNFQAILSESSDTLISEFLQIAELDDKQKSVAGKLLLEFEELFSRKLDVVGRIKMTRHQIDTGTNFTYAVFKGMCRILGIDKTQTTPLLSQLDGMVESFTEPS
ncbi:retroviral aspartyl protease family protein [Nephila pilipes]|uniref:Retroviral aspartyl protease family protein n=1 Tax=Nephila pilipes TaxID=299642 RepID=A0A8X6QQC0_NEPPI|nr:retroviral aspartyl protease family protein [Nephila pilipes]